jgi:DNA-binding NarL/FixJ family response regulator
MSADLVRAQPQPPAVSAGLPGGRLVAVSAEVDGHLQRGLLRLTAVEETTLYAAGWPRAKSVLTLEVPPPRGVDALWLMHLADRFKLTPVQRSGLESVGRGLTVEEIAVARGIKVGTVRAHLHELLSKTGQAKQAGLARLAAGR